MRKIILTSILFIVIYGLFPIKSFAGGFACIILDPRDSCKKTGIYFYSNANITRACVNNSGILGYSCNSLPCSLGDKYYVGGCGGAAGWTCPNGKLQCTYYLKTDDGTCGGKDCGCVDVQECHPPTDPPQQPTATPNPTKTPTPKPPTATPVPARPALCQSATISSSTLSSGGSLTITSTANTSDIKTFTYAFYNLDNLYGPNNPKPIFFVANTHYVRADNTTPPVNPPFHSVTINYDEINKPDLNWSSQKPTKIQVNAYFTNSQGGFSLPDARCVVKFNITLASPTATPVPGCLCNTDGSCATVCAFDKFAAPITYANPIKCSLSPLLFATNPSTANKTSWCQANKRTKGDADGNGIINTTDYFYYVAAVNGGKIPVTANPDFDGDGIVSNLDRTIIIKSLNP